MALGRHARIDQDLRQGVLGGRRLLAVVGGLHGTHEIERMKVRDVLEGVGDRLDEIFLAYLGHGGSL
jgi:hypothetical protein